MAMGAGFDLKGCRAAGLKFSPAAVFMTGS